MKDLQKALDLLTEEFGELDNIKFMLGSGEGMSCEKAESEILGFAEGVRSGAFKAQTSFPEARLRDSEITL